MRGRNNNRSKGPNPLTRSYESNGPDVKIRGTAQHIADKYAQLARDAQSSGDPVAAENYFQHAEHYYRMIAAAQEQLRQQYGTAQRPFDEESDEGDEEGAPNGFGYGDRQQGAQMDDMGEGYPQPYVNGGDRGPQPRYDRQDRGDRPDRGERQDRGQRFDRNERYDRQGGQDRQGQDRPGQDRYNQDRGQDRGQDRSNQDRNNQDRGQERNGQDRGERFDRPAERGERQDRGERRERYPRGGGDSREQRRDLNRPDRQPRGEQPRGNEERGSEDDVAAANLPAFLTNPVRPPVTATSDDTEPAVAAPETAGGHPESDIEGARPRTRRPRARRTAEPAEDLAEIEKTAE
jgi:hypothetical protein